MKLSRTALLAAAESAIAADRKAHDVVQADKVKAHEVALGKWKDSKAPRLAEELTKLAQRARRGQPVTRDALLKISGDGWGSSGHLVWKGAETAPKPEPYKPVRDIESLAQFLRGVSDEEITHPPVAEPRLARPRARLPSSGHRDIGSGGALMDVVRSTHVQRSHLSGPPVLIELDLVTIDGEAVGMVAAALSPALADELGAKLQMHAAADFDVPVGS